jgi:hypothetical protein
MNTAASRTTPRRLRISVATEQDREVIYHLRHSVYARELRQHPERADERLVDRLDRVNVYLVVKRDEEILGFVSITPPGGHGYSLEKYVRRTDLPFPVDHRTYEVRLLTVREGRRGGPTAGLLLLAVFKWIQGRGGTRVIALGRREVLTFYRKVGLVTVGIEVKSGAVAYELMTATTHALDAALQARPAVFERAFQDADMQVDGDPHAVSAPPSRVV